MSCARNYRLPDIKQTVLDRVELYKVKSRDEDYNEKKKWYNNDFLTFCKQLNVDLLYWEEIIEFIKNSDKKYGENLDFLYNECKKWNTSSYSK